MAKVKINEANLRHCRCPQCPVQQASKCSATSLNNSIEKPEAILYCAIGKSQCDDLDTGQGCQCPSCLVWDENNLKNTYYCTHGSVEEID